MFKQILSLLAFLALSLNVHAELVNNDPNNLVSNGSFTGDLKNGEFTFPGTPPDWNVISSGAAINSPDTMDETANFGIAGFTNFAANPSATPDGETWVGLAIGSNQNERIGQTVNGFIKDTFYTISWYEGNFGYSAGGSADFLGANAIEVMIGNDYSFSSTTSNPGNFLAVGSDWVSRSFTFQATQTGAYDVSFGLINPSSRAYMSLDGVSITAAVPEPSTYAMLLVGGLLIAGFKRKQHL